MRVYRTVVLAVAGIAALAGIATGVADATGHGATRCAAYRDATHPQASHRVCGAILDRYQQEGGSSGRLGLPTSDLGPVRLAALRRRGYTQCIDFASATIYLDPNTGQTTIGRWVAYRPPQPSPA
jgi:uncharacterized protein with LGFP repeats